MFIYVTRHGQTNWNLQHKVMGRFDESLNEKGIEQLYDKDIDLIISSPLLRAKQTALLINDGKNIPVTYDDRIIERDFGEFEGRQTKDFDFRGYWNYYLNQQYEKAENIQDFFKRVYDFLDDITQKYQDKNILIVTHGGVSIPIACYFKKMIPEGSFLDMDFVLGNCEVKTYTRQSTLR